MGCLFFGSKFYTELQLSKLNFCIKTNVSSFDPWIAVITCHKHQQVKSKFGLSCFGAPKFSWQQKAWGNQTALRRLAVWKLYVYIM